MPILIKQTNNNLIITISGLKYKQRYEGVNMNSFDYNDSFIGSLSIKELQASFDRLFSEVSNLRKRLGKEAHLLDEYVSSLMDSDNWTLAYEAGTDGFEKMEGLRKLCSGIVLNKNEDAENSFYGKARAYIESHPLDQSDIQIKISIYAALLSKEFFETAIRSYHAEKEASLAQNISELHDQCEKINKVLGSPEPMQKVNELFRRCFIVVSPLTCFVQGLLNGLLYELDSKSSDNSETVFQLLLDKKINRNE